MSDLANGKYLILSYAAPKPWAGADNFDHCAVKQVVTDGTMKVWSTKDVGRVYQLVLDENWYASNNGDKVVVHTSVDPGTRWVIIRATKGEGLYQIILDDTNEAWTATAGDPKEPVVLKPLVNPPQDDQLWAFIPQR